jgi:hypothetical protein
MASIVSKVLDAVGRTTSPAAIKAIGKRAVVRKRPLLLLERRNSLFPYRHLGRLLRIAYYSDSSACFDRPPTASCGDINCHYICQRYLSCEGTEGEEA